ncbi:MAG TPA: serine protease [Coleofasciculaceae cyanobacterium]|jgi:hypothetical protein
MRLPAANSTCRKRIKPHAQPLPALQFSGASDSQKDTGGLFDKFIGRFRKLSPAIQTSTQEVQTLTLEKIAELRRQNTVRLSSNNFNIQGSGVMIRDGKMGDYYILTAKHLLKGSDDDFFFISRNPESGEITTGTADIAETCHDHRFSDYNDLMLLKIRQGSCHGPLNTPFIPIAESGENLIFSEHLHLHGDDPAIICSSGASTGRGAMDKVTLGRFKDPIWIHNKTAIKPINGRIERGDSGSAIYDELGRLAGILIQLDKITGFGYCLGLPRLQKFLREQCHLNI